MSGGGGGSTEVKETHAERAQAHAAASMWNDYQERYVPLENQLIGTVQNADSAGNVAQATGHANAASEQQFSDARGQLAGNLFNAGFNPASGGFQSRMGDMATNEAMGTGMNEAGSRQSLSDQKAYGLEGIAQIGRGQSSDAFQGYGQAATSAQSQAISDARNALNSSLATQQLEGSVLGAGAAYGMGSIAQPSAGSYSGGMTGVSAQQWQAPSNYGISNSAGLGGFRS